MRIVCVGYRKWALDIYDEIVKKTKHTTLIIRKKSQYNEKALYDFKPNIIFFYGWSWTISKKIIDNFVSIMLHPSPLPKYMGGSPLQNQIIAGETKSAITLFRMSNEIDAGNILAQEEISLEGHLSEIFHRITEVGLRLTINILENGFTEHLQDLSKATVFKRRKPEESEITVEELKNSDAVYLFNKIRMLEDPYPNAFIRTKDGKKLLFKRVELDEDEK